MGSVEPTPGQLWQPERGSIAGPRLVVAISSASGVYFRNPKNKPPDGLNYATKARWAAWVKLHGAALADRPQEPRGG